MKDAVLFPRKVATALAKKRLNATTATVALRLFEGLGFFHRVSINQAAFAEKIGMTPPQVRRAMRKLQEIGLLRAEKIRGIRFFDFNAEFRGDREI